MENMYFFIAGLCVLNILAFGIYALLLYVCHGTYHAVSRDPPPPHPELFFPSHVSPWLCLFLNLVPCTNNEGWTMLYGFEGGRGYQYKKTKQASEDTHEKRMED
jgi:hypothetical protein